MFLYNRFHRNATSFTGFLKSYTANISQGDGRGDNFKQFYLLEKRYYNDSGKPVKKIFIKRADSSVLSAQNFDTMETNEVRWEQLPKKLKNGLKQTLATILDLITNYLFHLYYQILAF